MTTPPGEPWTVLKLLDWTKDYLTRGGVDDARLSAEVLLAGVLGCRRIELYTRFDYQPTKAQLEAFREQVARARRHEPIAYLVGTKEFYSLPFKVTPDVLIPRPETELLVAEAVTHLKALGRPGLAWDVCTGSGCVAVAVASQVKDATVLATDISPPAVAIAAENAAANKVGDRVRCRQADLLALPGDCAGLKDFDVITANPPYVAQGQEVAPSVRHEPAIALWAGKDGLALIEAVIAAVPALLRAGALLAMEFGQGQADAVRGRLVQTRQFGEPRILRDHQGIERAASAVRKT